LVLCIRGPLLNSAAKVVQFEAARMALRDHPSRARVGPPLAAAGIVRRRLCLNRPGLATMSNIANYSATEILRNGRMLEVRAFRPEDRDNFIAAVGRIGPLTRYRRFFTLKTSFTEREKDFFLNVDFDKHVALNALLDEAGRQVVVAAGRYVLVQPKKAEVAFTVIDQYQGQGIAPILLRHLVGIARSAGLQTLIAEVLRENSQMLKVFERSGLPVQTTADDPEVIHVTMHLV
jgi:GNAT superfamily N-acetyltransferase